MGGALEAREVPAGEGYLTAEAVGEVEKDEGVLVIRRIHTTYRLKITHALLAEKRDAIDRAYGLHRDRCPVARTLRAAVEITTELQFEEV